MFFLINPASLGISLSLRTMSDKQLAEALDNEGGGGKHTEAGRRETKKEMWVHPSDSVKGHVGLCCDTCTSKCMQGIPQTRRLVSGLKAS